MKISFDKAKNDRNITLRGLSFEMVADLDWDNAVIREDSRKVYGEPRYRTPIQNTDTECSGISATGCMWWFIPRVREASA